MKKTKETVVDDQLQEDVEKNAAALAKANERPVVDKELLGYKMLKHGDIHPSPTNPRKYFDADKLKALAGNIAEQGILQPLVVRCTVHPIGETVRYELVAGERRWRASEIAKLDLVPCMVRNLSDNEVLEIQYIENLQREDLTALEEAEGFKQLIDSGAYTADTLAEKLGMSRSHVFNRLKLMKLGRRCRK